MNTFVGLDQSLNNTGIAIKRGPKVVTTVIKHTSSRSVFERVLLTRDLLRQILTAAAPAVVYMEDVFYVRKNISAVTSLIRVENMVQLLCHDLGTCTKSLPASPRLTNSWSRQLGFTNTKEDAAAFFLPYFVTNSKPTEHETDALGILHGGLISDNLATRHCMLGVQIQRVEPKDALRNPTELTDRLL